MERFQGLDTPGDVRALQPVFLGDFDMTPSRGPWTIEERRDQNIGYFVILNADGRVIMDTFNSEVQLIQSEEHYESIDQWDEQGRIDCELVVELWKLLELLTKGEVGRHEVCNHRPDSAGAQDASHGPR